MATPTAGRAAPNPLARVRFVLAPGAARRSRFGGYALTVAALLVGAAAGQVYAPYGPALTGAAPATQPTQTAAPQELPALRQGLEQARLQLRVADARGHELERQIDALNQRLRAAEEELGFFRKAREPRR